MTTTPILKILHPFKGIFVCTDACKEGLSIVLIQENQVMAYESTKLKEHGNNYTTYNLELAAMINALKIWWQYLIQRNFLFMLEDISFKYLFD